MKGLMYTSAAPGPAQAGTTNGYYVPMEQVHAVASNGVANSCGGGGGPVGSTLAFSGRSPSSGSSPTAATPRLEPPLHHKASRSRLSAATDLHHYISRAATDSGDSDDAEPRQTRLQSLVTSSPFQTCTMVMITANTLAMAVEADYPSWEIWPVVDGTFLLYFTVELSLRLCAFGCSFFTSERGTEEQGWNIFDFAIVLLGILDTCVLSRLMANKKNKVGRWFMMLRILRIARALKIFKSFPELNRLARGLMESTQYVIYIFILLGLLMLVGAIFCVNLVGKEPEMFDDPEKIVQWFGTVPAAMETLFIFLTLDDWSTPARMVSKEISWMNIFWIVFVMLGPFTLLSLLTGLMADRMEAARVEANDHQEQVTLEATRQLLESLKRIFIEITPEESRTRSLADISPQNDDREANGHDDHVDGDGLMVTRAMFLEHVPTLCEELKKIDIILDPDEMPEIFDCFDKDGSGTLGWDEFRDGIIQINDFGATKAMVMWLEGEIVKLDNHVSSSDATWDLKLGDLHKRATSMQKSVAKLEKNLTHFFLNVGYDPGLPNAPPDQEDWEDREESVE